MVCFRTCSSLEHEIEWDEDIWSLHVDLNEAIVAFQDTMEHYIERALALDDCKMGTRVKVIYCFSDSSSDIFRKKLLKTYKLNRVGKRKPVAYWALKQWVAGNCETAEMKHLEADDVIGILATGKYKGKSIILSGDKDMKSIPGKVYDFIHDEFTLVSPDEADKFHLRQTLIGDPADNYSGCPKIGEKRADKLFEDYGATWNTVLYAFAKEDMDEKEALVQARVSYILRSKDYNVKTGKVKLWKPK